MKKTTRSLWIPLILTALAMCVICFGSGGAQAAAAAEILSDATAAPALTAAPASTPTPEATAEPESTPLLTEYAFGAGTTWEQVEQVIRENPALQQLDLRESGLDVRERSAWLTGLDKELLFRTDLCGIEVGHDTETLNYNDQPIESLEPFYQTLPLLTKLTSLEMCGCGVGNEEMDALRTAFPEAGIVWSITSKYWTVRTDADHFATWRVVRTDEEGKILEAYSISFNTNADMDWLQYCHDLVALDVGHNKLTNCEFVRNMPNLEYLIIADNRISDLSPIATLPKLKYLEIFANPVTDLTPLSELTKLLDINMCGCYISDLSPLYGLPQLERVWMTPYNLKNYREAAKEFNEALPNCVLQYINSKDFTGKGWRRHPRYTEYRLALGRAKP